MITSVAIVKKYPAFFCVFGGWWIERKRKAEYYMQSCQGCLYKLKFMTDYDSFISIYGNKHIKNTMNKAKT